MVPVCAVRGRNITYTLRDALSVWRKAKWFVGIHKVKAILTSNSRPFCTLNESCSHSLAFTCLCFDSPFLFSGTFLWIYFSLAFFFFSCIHSIPWRRRSLRKPSVILPPFYHLSESIFSPHFSFLSFVCVFLFSFFALLFYFPQLFVSLPLFSSFRPTLPHLQLKTLKIITVGVLSTEWAIIILSGPDFDPPPQRWRATDGNGAD